MPGPGEDYLVKPDVAPVTVKLEPAHNAINSLLLLREAGDLSGLDDWVTRTAALLTPEERATNDLVMIGLHYAVMPKNSWPSFPAYCDHLSGLDPVDLRDKMLEVYTRVPLLEGDQCGPTGDQVVPLDADSVLRDVDAYLAFLRQRFPAGCLDEELEARAYAYVVDPPAMRELIVSHLRRLWEAYLAPEWERVEPMLQDAVRAFQQIDLGDRGRLEAAELITGRAQAEDAWQHKLEAAEQVTFCPSAHTGPYLGKLWSGDRLWVMFGARVPEGVPFHAPDLSRAEILVRLGALSDNNRLRILKFISEEGEQRSQEVISCLGLSQSAVSRHLKQLTATGYLTERRCNGAKCYKLNPQRITNTLQALSTFLLGS
jgi:DNA-binding transcriptional ArsR family regulator